MSKLRVAIIGTGMIANQAHFPALNVLRQKGIVDVVAVADIRPEAAAETAARHNVEKWYQDPQKMLDEVKPDFVAVCTPNVYHKQWTIAALKAGAHVACEKPIATSYADAKEMWETAEKEGKMLFPCQCMRWRNYMQQTKHLVEMGELGTPYFSQADFVRRIGIPTWGMFHMKEHNFGGPFCDLGVHVIDALLWICGAPKLVSASGASYSKIAPLGEDIHLSIAESGAYAGTFTPRPYDYREFSVEEFANGFLRFDNGMSVNFKFTWAVNLPTSNLELKICGEKGGVDVVNGMLYKNVGKYQSDMQLKWFDNGEFRGVPFEQHRYMYDNILNTIAGKEEYLIKKHENLEVAKVIECYYKSAELGREVRAEEVE